MTTITFVRHGLTDHNAEKRTQGHTQNPLNEAGRAQAALVAKRLAETEWDAFLSSDLRRARETAEIISAVTGKSVDSFDVRLREMDRGKIAGTTEAERIERWGVDWRRLDMEQETHESMRMRGTSFAEEISSRFAGKRILVVTHGYFLGQTLKALLQDEATGNDLRNTSVTTVERRDGRWNCLLYDCVRHLSDD